MFNYLLKYKTYFEVIFFSLMGIVTSTWFAEGSKELIMSLPCLQSGDVTKTNPIFTVVSLFVFFFSAHKLVLINKNFIPIRTLSATKGRSTKGVKALVVFMSPPNDNVFVFKGVEYKFEKPHDNNSKDVISGKKEEKENIIFINPLNYAGPNEKFSKSKLSNLNAAVDYCGADLEKVFLLGSKDDKRGLGSGSGYYLKEVCKLFESLFPNVKFIVSNDAMDFEDVEGMREQVSNLIDSLIKENAFSIENISLDTTGGQKTTSIAGALATLKYPGLKFQYVSTNTSLVSAFDVTIESVPKASA